VVRSLEGGGIAVNRLALFTAAGHALANAPPGAGLALTDPSGNVHAWWGDAPPLVGLEFSSGGIAVRWSATRLVVVQRKPVGDGGFSGLVYSSRSFPVEAPDFARALGVAGAAAARGPADFGPVSPRSPRRLSPSRRRTLRGERARDAGARRPARRVPAFPAARGRPGGSDARGPLADGGAADGRVARPDLDHGGARLLGGGHRHEPGGGRPVRLVPRRGLRGG